ncbi:class I SAM-dependent methyltransferase [Nocardia coubleae]|uniref:Class I SAM-dependent methyltransferase n=1 Tax=Nocardia coubleae TaxID=356147 RepID=A0A846W1G0_9NOCA|nr:class I SAM-dependent methyltransferase [Nocardia coubleae]NKX86713.1 class I SAM-dependent methyltransferase [Nocardia coubleae]
MTSSNFAYTGCDNLEVMAEAINYNKFLLDCVEKHVTTTDLRVLDFGAGQGTYADLLAEREIFPECLEPDPDLQKVLLAKGYKVVDCDTEPPEAEKYGLIYSFNVFEHIKNDQEAAEHLASLLRPGGTMVIYVPALEMLFSSMDVKVEHYRRYRRTQLNRILRNAGLEVVDSRYCDPIGFFATMAYKLLGNDDGSINVRALKLYDQVVFPLSKALQSVTGKLFGKNVLVVARKP